MRSLSLIFSAYATAVALSGSALAYMGGSYPADPIPSDVNLGLGRDCSAVKVADDKFLTAAHCCNPNGPLGVGNPLTVYNTTETGQTGVQIDTTIKAVEIHPSWRGIDAGSVNGDLAIIEVENARAFGSAKISLDPVKVGDPITVGGYGCLGGNKDLQVTRTYLSVAFKTVSQIIDPVILVGLEDAGGRHLSMACNGDSGGPAYRESAATGELEVVGINSAVTLSPWTFTFDPVMSEIIGTPAVSSAEMLITRLGIPAAEDALGTVSWLRTNLPDSSFAR